VALLRGKPRLSDEHLVAEGMQHGFVRRLQRGVVSELAPLPISGAAKQKTRVLMPENLEKCTFHQYPVWKPPFSTHTVGSLVSTSRTIAVASGLKKPLSWLDSVCREV